MTTVICGYTNCSYNKNSMYCGKNIIRLGTRKYGPVICPCNSFTTEEVDDLNKFYEENNEVKENV